MCDEIPVHTVCGEKFQNMNLMSAKTTRQLRLHFYNFCFIQSHKYLNFEAYEKLQTLTE